MILCIGETHNLINYVSFINYLSYGVTIAGLLYYRWRKPNLYRPIKVPPHEPRQEVARRLDRQHELSLSRASLCR